IAVITPCARRGAVELEPPPRPLARPHRRTVFPGARTGSSRASRDEEHDTKGELTMQRPLRLALTTTLVALVPLSAYAQATAFFAQPFKYTDSNGTGTLTVTPLSTETTRSRFQPVSATLDQNNVHRTGSGVYHYLGDDNADLPPFALLSFTVVDPQGNSRFYQ